MRNTIPAEAIVYLLRNEGEVYTNTPGDSGGPTKYGVTQKSYSSYLGRLVSAAEIEALTTEQIQPFYFDRYWRPLWCDRISNLNLATAIFDTGVLYGVGTAVRLIQKSLCLAGIDIEIDGIIGPKTVKALEGCETDKFLKNLHLFILQRIDAVIRMNPKNEKFRYGWRARAQRLLTLYAPTESNKI